MRRKTHLGKQRFLGESLELPVPAFPATYVAATDCPPPPYLPRGHTTARTGSLINIPFVSLHLPLSLSDAPKGQAVRQSRSLLHHAKTDPEVQIPGFFTACHLFQPRTIAPRLLRTFSLGQTHTIPLKAMDIPLLTLRDGNKIPLVSFVCDRAQHPIAATGSELTKCPFLFLF